MLLRGWSWGLWLAGGLELACGASPATLGGTPATTSAPLVTLAPSTGGSAAARETEPAAPASGSSPVAGPGPDASAATAAQPGAELPTDERLPAGVGFLDPYESSDAPLTPLRFAHATSRGVIVHLGFATELGVDTAYLQGRKPKPVAVRGVSPAIDIVPLVAIPPPEETSGLWELFAGDQKLCEGKLVGFERATYLRNLEGQRSMGCQAVAEGLGAPLSAQDVAEHYTLMGGFGLDATARIEGCAAPKSVAFLWARPAGRWPAPQNVRTWATDTSVTAAELYARTTTSPAWRELAGQVRQEYSGALPGSPIPSRKLVGRRAGAPNGFAGWSVFAQLGNIMDWTGKVTPVAETTLWDLYPDEPGTQPWIQLRVKRALEVEMVASGQLGDGVEIVAIARAQCHDKWLMLTRQGHTLRIRRELAVTCWCAD